MTVKELIEELKKYEPTHEVFIDTESRFPDGRESIFCIEEVYDGICRNVNIKI